MVCKGGERVMTLYAMLMNHGRTNREASMVHERPLSAHHDGVRGCRANCWCIRLSSQAQLGRYHGRGSWMGGESGVFQTDLLLWATLRRIERGLRVDRVMLGPKGDGNYVVVCSRERRTRDEGRWAARRVQGFGCNGVRSQSRTWRVGGGHWTATCPCTDLHLPPC
jgi:hypothetical protein